MEILGTCVECVDKACAKLEAMGISRAEIKSVGIANQRGECDFQPVGKQNPTEPTKCDLCPASETTVVWDRLSGKPLHNAVVWLDTRTAELAEQAVQKTPTK